MKKRLISLVLMLAMAVSTVSLFTGCGNSGNIQSESTIKPMTITIAMITEEETTPEGIQAVQDALNRITENDLNTHIVLQLYTAEEYDAAIAEKIRGRLEYRANNSKDLVSSTDKEDKKLNEYGREITVYPEPYENQIDIFLLNGINNFNAYTQYKKLDATDEQFAENPAAYSEKILASLETYTATDAAGELIPKYISADLLNSCTVDGALLAIPSNGFYGNSEYLVVNKEMFNAYAAANDIEIDEDGANIGEIITDVVSLEGFLTDVATNNPDVTPLYNYGSLGLVSVTGKNSSIAAWVPDGADPAAMGWEPKALTDIDEFRAAVTSITNFASINGTYPEIGTDLPAAGEGNYAAGFVSTDSLGIAEYAEDYYTIMVRKSMVTTEQVYDNAFAVFQYTTDVARCMEIINLIQTDRDFQNILRYGLENTTYTVDEDTGIVNIKRDGTDGKVYCMDQDLCGNLFISKPNNEMSEPELIASANEWKSAKEASRNLFYSPYMGFELSVGDNATLKQPSEETIESLEKVYNALFDEIENYPNVASEYTDFDNYYDAYLKTWIQAAEGYVTLNQSSQSDNTYINILRQYKNWYTARYGVEE